MKPIHKFNGGREATLCHTCRTIISLSHSDTLFCKPCLETKELCDCGKVATWDYMPGYSNGDNSVSCDDCVPRLCSCNHHYINEEYNDEPPLVDDEGINWKWIKKDISWCYIDDEGREYPCCEYMYDEEGWLIEELN